MIISDSKKFAFIHVGKTGGSTIAFALNKYSKKYKGEIDETKRGWQVPLHVGPMHDPFVKAKEHIPEDYYTFAFVRNPFAVLVSGFRRKRMPDFGGGEMYKNFETFVEKALDKETNYIFSRWTQYEYLSNNGKEDGKILLNHVGKFETFEEDFDIIASDLGIPERYATLPRKNASTKEKDATNSRAYYEEYYTDKARKIVEERYKKDLEYWGYEF